MTDCPKCQQGGTGPHPAYCTPAMRFWAKVRIVGACWEWQGAQNGRGYGEMRLGNRKHYVHRWVVEQVWGDIPADGVVMHLCDNPRCVRPAHLNIGTQRENIQDAVQKGRMKSNRSERLNCKNGHRYTPENTAITKAGHRRCRECENAPRRIEGGRGPYNRRRVA